MTATPPPAPERFICPISLSPMKEPTIVDHNGRAYWFEKRCLDLHAHTAHADRNPITNETGFAAALRALDTELQKEIQSSQWAEEIEEECFSDIEEDGLVPSSVPTRSEVFDEIMFVVDVTPAIVSLPRPWAITISRALSSVLDAWEESGTPRQFM